jgi:aspartate racemase
MRRIGLIGGMSWESSAEYYRIINETIHAKLGGVHSAEISMYSFDFDEIETMQRENRWDEAAARLADVANCLERGQAECIVICTNTMHRLADAVQAEIKIPVLHIADCTAEKVIEKGIQTVGLLGTKYTMEEDFYRGRLESEHDLKVLIPDTADRQIVHDVIYNELVVGEIKPESKGEYIRIMKKLVEQGAAGIILGCTEIGLLVKQEDCAVPVFDTAVIHAVYAAEWALDPNYIPPWLARA